VLKDGKLSRNVFIDFSNLFSAFFNNSSGGNGTYLAGSPAMVSIVPDLFNRKILFLNSQTNPKRISDCVFVMYN